MAKSILFPAETPRLWSIEVMDGDKAVSRVDICADSAVQKGFARPALQVNGQPCDKQLLDTISGARRPMPTSGG